MTTAPPTEKSRLKRKKPEVTVYSSS